jgi:hypothetical protein
MLTHVEFRSSAFPPYDSESQDINPGRFGTRLAEYLSAELRKRGEKVGDPDGFLCFIEPHTEYVRKLRTFWKRVPTRQRIEELQYHVDDARGAHEGILDIK